MMNRAVFLSAVAGLVLGFASTSASAETNAPYAGQQEREVRSLSAERLQGLKAGAGLGYAKSAELNGWPGPLHILELADELKLSESQRAQVETIRHDMLRSAKGLGEQLIEAERELDLLFQRDDASRDEVAIATRRAANIEAALRATHLEAHLKARPLLTRHQIVVYNRARGYDRSSSHSHSGH